MGVRTRGEIQLVEGLYVYMVLFGDKKLTPMTNSSITLVVLSYYACISTKPHVHVHCTCICYTMYSTLYMENYVHSTLAINRHKKESRHGEQTKYMYSAA